MFKKKINFNNKKTNPNVSSFCISSLITVFIFSFISLSSIFSSLYSALVVILFMARFESSTFIKDGKSNFSFKT